MLLDAETKMSFSVNLRKISCHFHGNVLSFLNMCFSFQFSLLSVSPLQVVKDDNEFGEEK